jgi:transcriptional regulator with XRE-family HTH domain
MKKIPIINQIIKDKRKELKITQQDFTKIINKAISTVRRYDTGDIIPENTLILICDKLNLSIHDLANKQNEENKSSNLNYYNDFVTKYRAKILDYDFSNQEVIKDLLKARTDFFCSSLASLYSILYSDFYRDLEHDNFHNERWDLQSTEYIAIPDLENDKITVKQIKIFSNNEREEKIIDILKERDFEEIKQTLKEIFNIKLLVKRKLKLRHEKLEKSINSIKDL